MPVLAMLSGGRDSVCLLDLTVRCCGAENVQALHVNYGLRPEADEDARLCTAGVSSVRAGVGGQRLLEVVRAERRRAGRQPAGVGARVRYGAAPGRARP